MSLPDLGEKVERTINVEIGNKYYYQIGKSETYSLVTITGKRFYPDDKRDGGFVYTNPPNTAAVGKHLDPSELNKFFRISTRKYNEIEYIEQSKSDILEQVSRNDNTKPELNEKLKAVEILNTSTSAPENLFSRNPVPIQNSTGKPSLPVSINTKLPTKNMFSPAQELTNNKNTNLLR